MNTFHHAALHICVLVAACFGSTVAQADPIASTEAATPGSTTATTWPVNSWPESQTVEPLDRLVINFDLDWTDYAHLDIHNFSIHYRATGSLPSSSHRTGFWEDLDGTGGFGYWGGTDDGSYGLGISLQSAGWREALADGQFSLSFQVLPGSGPVTFSDFDFALQLTDRSFAPLFPSAAAVPEPGALALVGVGLLAAAGMTTRRTRRPAL